MVPTTWRALGLETMPPCTTSNADLSGSTLEELMLSRKSMTGILSLDLFSGDTLEGGGGANAGVRFLGLAMRATDGLRNCVSEEMRRNIKCLR